MLLTIQPHESLRSFLERHFYLDSQSLESITFKKISRYYMRGSSISCIAQVLGRSDTYSFNRLLHDHTSYSQVAVFPDASQRSYARSSYQRCTTRFETEGQLPGICLDCVKEDIDSRGFPYWRRDHRYVKVCAKHNTVLLKKCPVCRKDISIHGDGYGHDILWKGCRGQHLQHYESEKNQDEEALSFSKIFAEIGESKYAVNREDMLLHLANDSKRLAALGLICEDQLEEIDWMLDPSKQISYKGTTYRPDFRYSEKVINVMAFMYGSFSVFLDSFRKVGGTVRNLDELMRVEYQAE